MQTKYQPKPTYGSEYFEMVPEGEWVTKRLIGLCRVAGCERKHGDKKALCNKHDAEVWRYNHPLEAAFKGLKCSAKKRKIVITLTLDQFKLVISDTDYLERKGRGTEALQIDRVDAKRGYEFDNVRVITGYENLARREGYKPPAITYIESSDSWLYEDAEDDSDPF